MSFQLRGSLQAAGPMAAMSNDSTTVQYTFNSNIMVAAMVILFVVVFFVVGLHVYAKWFWRQRIPFTDRQMAMSWRRRRIRHEDHEPFVLVDDTNNHGGLDKSIRDALPTFSYQTPMNVKEGVPLECAVCLSEFQQNEKGRLLPICKHSFHIDCIDMWFMSHSTCPLCRAALVVIPTGKSRSMEASVSGNSSLVNGNHGHLEQGGELHVHTEVTQTTAEGGNPTPICPSGVVLPPPHIMLVWNQHRLSYQLSSPCLGGHGSSSTRSLPSSSATDMVARCPDGSPVARCVSFSLSSATAAVGGDHGCSSSRPAISKSASARNPIKWLLRREMSKGKSRVYPSSRQGSVDLDQNSCPCTSSSLPV